MVPLGESLAGVEKRLRLFALGLKAYRNGVGIHGIVVCGVLDHQFQIEARGRSGTSVLPGKGLGTPYGCGSSVANSTAQARIPAPHFGIPE